MAGSSPKFRLQFPSRRGEASNAINAGLPSASSVSPAAVASPLIAIGFALTCVYVLIAFGRLPEIAVYFLKTSGYMALIVTLTTFPVALLTGGIWKAIASPLGTVWFALHAWVVLTLPFSGHRSASVLALQYVATSMPLALYSAAFFGTTLERLQKGIQAFAWAGVVALGWIEFSSKADSGDNRLQAFGTFGNSNEVAIFLLGMVPLFLYVVTLKGCWWPTRILFAGATAWSFWTVILTGSRSGLLTIGILTLTLFATMSVANKMKFVVVVVTVGVLLASATPEQIKARFSTIMNSEVEKDTVASGAVASSESRVALLEESIRATLQHPLFGTGFAAYVDVVSEESKKEGRKALWQVSHNMYTQISAETGIPGLALFLGIFYIAARTHFRVLKARRLSPELGELGRISTALLYTMLVVVFNGCFTSMAWSWAIYEMVGLAIAVWYVHSSLTAAVAAQTSASAGIGADGVSEIPATAAAEAASPLSSSSSRAHRENVPDALVGARGGFSGRSSATPAKRTPGRNSYDDAPWRRNPRKQAPK